MSKKIEERGVIRHMSKKRLGMAVELYREGSGAYVLEMPGNRELADLKLVSEYNYGHVCIGIRPSLSPGYHDKYGVTLVLIPGDLAGSSVTDSNFQKPRRQRVQASDLPYLHSGADNNKKLAIATNLDGAIRLHKALGLVIENAKKLTREHAEMKAKKV